MAQDPHRPRRVAVFGLLGSGNIGNEGSLRAVLAELRRHPEVEVSAICAGPDDVRRRYGLPAVSMTAFRLDRPHRWPAGARALKAVSKLADPVRTALLLRRVDLVVVPGMGVLEDTLPLRWWGFPYALLSLTLAGRLTRTPVALLSVGATRPSDPVLREVVRRSAAAAFYRSYRDAPSRDAVGAMGVDTSRDAVYPDLAFALDLPERVPLATAPTVAVGVMAYRRCAEDPRQGERVLARYTASTVDLVGRLVDEGFTVRLLTGDPDDAGVAVQVEEEVRRARPALGAERVGFTPADSLEALMGQIAPVWGVVASRYHNVLCALRMGKPTVSLGYAEKTAVLMREMGLGHLCLDIRDFDACDVVTRLRGALEEGARLEPELRRRDALLHDRLDAQWGDLRALAGLDRTPARGHHMA